MDDIYYDTNFKQAGNSAKDPALKQVFHSYAEQTISKDQEDRTLEPVLQMIANGVFSQPKRYLFWPQMLLTVMVVLVMSVVAVLANSTNVHSTPLVGPPEMESVSANAVCAGDLSPGYCCGEATGCEDRAYCAKTFRLSDEEDSANYAFYCTPGREYRPCEAGENAAGENNRRCQRDDPTVGQVGVTDS